MAVTCGYCEQEALVMPAGENGRMICSACAVKPENIKNTKAFMEHMTNSPLLMQLLEDARQLSPTEKTLDMLIGAMLMLLTEIVDERTSEEDLQSDDPERILTTAPSGVGVLHCLMILGHVATMCPESYDRAKKLVEVVSLIGSGSVSVAVVKM